jgi:hypothetical protein
MPEPAQAPQDKTWTPKAQPARPRRFWLWAPYIALLVAILAWSVAWLVMKLRLEHELDARAQALRARGYAASWSARSVGGYPFRLDVTFDQPRLGEPSGWAVAAPVLKAEAYAYLPDRWIFVAPQGLTLIRPGKGPLAVAGQAIRASVGDLGGPAPRFSFEGLGLTMAAGPGGQPGPIASAARIELHLQPGPDDQAALLVRVQDAQLSPDAPLGRLAPLKPVTLVWDLRLSHLSAFAAAPDWPSAVRAWTIRGGAVAVAKVSISAGSVALQGNSGTLTVGADGRLAGDLPLGLQTGKDGLAGPPLMALSLQGGRARLGLVDLGPALKVY